MATVTQKSFTLSDSNETSPVLRTIDPDGNVARRPVIVAPVFNESTLHGTISQTQRGTTMTKVAPVLSAGDSTTRYKKVHGPDDMIVDAVTGVASWVIPSGELGQAHNMSIRAWNGAGDDLISWVEIVKATGTDVGVHRVGSTQTYTNVQAAVAVMSSGDVMVLDCETYTGTSNTIAYNTGFPGGTSSQMSCMVAISPPDRDLNAVILDGENTNTMIRIQGNHWNADWAALNVGASGVTAYDYDYTKISGIVIIDDSQDPFFIGYTQYSYIKYCIIYHTSHPGGPGAVGMRNAWYSTNTLCEDCMSLGGGVRYSISPARSRKHVSRRNHIRHGQYGNPADVNAGTQPVGGLAIYLMRDCHVANNVFFDADDDVAKFWTNHYDIASAITNANTSYEDWSSGITTDRNIVTNCSYGAYDSTQRQSASIQIHNDLVAVDCLMTGANSGADAPAPVNAAQGPCDNFRHTYIMCHADDTSTRGVLAYNFHQRSEYNNSIFEAGYVRANGRDGDREYLGEWFDGSTVGPTAEGTLGCSVNDSIFYNPDSQTLFASTLPRYEENVNEITGINPFSSGLDYPQWISEGGSLNTDGPASSRVGAHCVTLNGKAGTFWGETDYNTETNIPMWPCPYEDVVVAWSRSIPDYTGLVRAGLGPGTYGSSATLLSKRGTVVDGMCPSSYICRKLGKATPQFSAISTVSGSTVTISWEPITASTDRDKTVKYLVYRGDSAGDNGILVYTGTPIEFNYDDSPGVGTHTYWILRRDTERGFSLRTPGYYTTAVVI